MTMNNLPHELQWRILSHLNATDQKQYSLVSRNCRDAALYRMLGNCCIKSDEDLDGLIGLLVKSSSMSSCVQKLKILQSNFHGHDKQYSTLIQLTPKLKEIEIGSSEDLFQMVLQEIHHGHWPHLNRIYSPLCKYYYAIASAIQDRLLNIVLDISSNTGTSSEPHCFQSALHITRETRFDAVENLEIHGRETATVQSLEDAIKLCPNAVYTKLCLLSLDQHEDRLVHIEPTTRIKELHIDSKDISEAYLDYVCRKFSKVDKLQFKVSSLDIEGMNQSWRASTQLVDYLYSIDNYSLSVGQDVEDCLPLFHALLSRQWPGEMSIYFCRSGFEVKNDKSKPKTSKLDIFGIREVLDPTQAYTRTYLSQLDELGITSSNSEDIWILSHCSQLKTLWLFYNDDTDYDDTVLPITYLDLELAPNYDQAHTSRGIDFINRFVACTPYLREALFTFHYSDDALYDGYEYHDLAILNMPFISFDSLTVTFSDVSPKDLVYLHLIQSGVEAYYREHQHEPQLSEISDSEFERSASESEMKVIRIRLICKDIKCLEIGTGPEEYLLDPKIIHNFG
ncbi:hypothetical protein BD560DRAFT_416100 [Blakeslea trispora]|nr:hypothetical protein BD560DRAFT_416100 [Blakeslea trispora]